MLGSPWSHFMARNLWVIKMGNKPWVSPPAPGAHWALGNAPSLGEEPTPGASILPWGSGGGRGAGDPPGSLCTPSPGGIPCPAELSKYGPGQTRHIRRVKSEFGKEPGNPSSLSLLVGDTGSPGNPGRASVLSGAPKFIPPLMSWGIILSPISPFPALGFTAGRGSKQQILSHPKGTERIPVDVVTSGLGLGVGGSCSHTAEDTQSPPQAHQPFGAQNKAITRNKMD